MATQIFSLHTDHTDHFRNSGSEALLSVGKALLEKDCRRFGRRTAESAAPTDLATRMGVLQAFIGKNPQNWLKPYVFDPETRMADPRVAKVLGFLGALLIFNGDDGADVMRIAAACSADGSPAEMLETRRVIACLGVQGVVTVDGNSGFIARLQLSKSFQAMLLGGAQCVPYLSDESFFDHKVDKERKAAGLGARAAKNSAINEPKAFLADLQQRFPVLTPRMLFEELERRGYVGQEDARRKMCLAAFRHLTRLRRIYVDGVAPDTLPRSNILLCGPTGSGKTLLLNTLFCEILKFPCIVADMTTFSETGFIGEDLSSMLTRLVCSYGVPIGEMAAVGMDEFDKLAEPGGADGGRSMVSRHGVQRGLLKLLEPGIAEVPTELGGHPYRSKRVPFKTGNLLWVGCGAFSGFKRDYGKRHPLGFGSKGNQMLQGGAARSVDMAAYGVLPELYGRFGIDVELARLSRDQMRSILDQNVVTQYRREFAVSGISLLVEPDVADLLVDKAIERDTGARGIQAELAASLQDAAFEAFSSGDKDQMVRLYAADGSVRWEVGKRPASAKMTPEDIAAIAESASPDALCAAS